MSGFNAVNLVTKRARKDYTCHMDENMRDDNPGPGSAGQSGDLQGISGGAEAGSESVAELLEEGQAFEAGIIDGVENTPDADVSEIRTREVREDDVPPEYLESDEPSVG
ncbi:MAG: hypothetical protein ABJC09_05010 [Terriglobia bacterium]